MTSPDITTQSVIDDLGSFYCHNIVVSLWADAVANRLEGLAIYLLSDELPEAAEHARAAAHRLADRIGDLGGDFPIACAPAHQPSAPTLRTQPRPLPSRPRP